MACLSFLVWPLHSLFRAVVPARLLPGASSFLRALLWPLQAAHPPPSPRPVWMWLLRLSLPYRTPLTPWRCKSKRRPPACLCCAAIRTFCTCAARLQQHAGFQPMPAGPVITPARGPFRPAGRLLSRAVPAGLTMIDRGEMLPPEQNSKAAWSISGDTTDRAERRRVKRRGAPPNVMVVPDLLVLLFFCFPCPSRRGQGIACTFPFFGQLLLLPAYMPSAVGIFGNVTSGLG